MENRLCKIPECGTWFEPKNTKDRSVYCCEDCRKEAVRRSYQKWKANNPERYKEFQRSQYKNRKRDGRVRLKNRYRNVPVGQEWTCRDCGRISHNRLYCPACHHRRSKDLSGEYENIVFIDAAVKIFPRRRPMRFIKKSP